MKLIPKDAVLAEIESRIKSMEECFNGKFPMSQSVKETEQDKGKLVAYKSILSLIDTLEVEEVDLETEIEEQCKKINQLAVGKELRNICRHFFELGLKAKKPLTWEDMMLIHKCIKDAMNYHLYKMMEGMEGQKVVYEEVLKRFKAQKGEEV